MTIPVEEIWKVARPLASIPDLEKIRVFDELYESAINDIHEHEVDEHNDALEGIWEQVVEGTLGNGVFDLWNNYVGEDENEEEG